MKFSKYLLYIVLSSTLFTLTSCGGSGSKNENSGKSNTAQEKIEAYAAGNNSAPTVQDYISAGITGIDVNNLEEINTKIQGLPASDIDTKEEIQAIADGLGTSPTCEKTQHKDGGVCVSNTKSVECLPSMNIPKNASSINNQVEVAWENNIWSTPANCKWNCNDGYQKNNNACELITPNQAPEANAGADITAAQGAAVNFDANTSTDKDGTITQWIWEENSTILSNIKSFSKDDFSVGTHTIKLTVTDNDGAISSDSLVVLITGNGKHKIKDNTEASLFLNRATFGPTKSSIKQLVDMGSYENWLEQQFTVPASLHLPRVDALSKKMCAAIDENGDTIIDSWEFAYPRHQIWWESALHADDQLRQRMALALSEILVISDSDGLGLSSIQRGVTSYYDLFVKHAFGNYRDLLEEVTLHPAMGDFLSLTRNQKEDIEEGIRPDENYAREVLQLFTIGVHELNQDGSEKLDENKQVIPTYNQKTIEEFAKVFTGWSYSDIDWYDYFEEADHSLPLKAFEEYHDTSEKTLLNGEKSPANKTAKEDLTFALDNIFNHPNIAPFVSTQLIQRFVTSNPSAAYIDRVASVFNNNGIGVKGDLKAVLKAILLDEEALSQTQSPSFGKLKEPLLRISHLWRNFPLHAISRKGHYWEEDSTCGQGTYNYYQFWDSLDSFANKLGQGPLQARSVFNFFRPDHSPNGVLNDKGLKAPEFQILNENTYVGSSNLIYYMITEFSDADGISDEVDVVSNDFSTLDLNVVTSLAKDKNKLLDYLSLSFLNNKMTPALRSIVLEHLNQNGVYPEGIDGDFVRAREAILLITSSPEYLIQR